MSSAFQIRFAWWQRLRGPDETQKDESGNVIVREVFGQFDRWASRAVGVERAAQNVGIQLERRRFEEAAVASLARRVRRSSRPARVA